MLRRLISSIYPSKKSRTPGKTTLLYRLKLGSVLEHTIPTIGFNVEEVDIPTSRGDYLKACCWDVGAGCGNMTMMLRLVQPVVDNCDAAVWFVDCTTVEWELEDSLRAFHNTFLLDPASALASVPILILATKQDKVKNTRVLDDIRIKFSKLLTGRTGPWFIMGVSLLEDFSSPTSGVVPAFDWLKAALETPGSDKRKQQQQLQVVSTTSPTPTPTDELSEKLDSWLTRLSTDSSADEFLSQFHALNLPSWDHYTHLRIAYHVLTKYGRQKGKNMIFEGIQTYIEQSPGNQTRKRTFHFTMTYFWIQMVHFGIRSIAPLISAESKTDFIEGEEEKEIREKKDERGSEGDEDKERDDFGKFLILNPYIARGDLWSEFYSKEVMMSKEAMEAVVLPDKKPLPDLVTRDLIDRLRRR
ncbi:hypothetical protein L218DRAFT_979883 [Marasmius fiardii PR-910]|nr:hypothetical protein L218DRAFT_979883 [Marasmius fiardii PR-910]